MAPDLPLEIWLDILALLPPGYLRKIMGLSRILFELAMSEIYHNAYVGSTDERAIWRFSMLK